MRPYLQRGKPARRPQLINEDDHTIVSTYGAEYRGIVQYYLLAGDVFRLHRLRWVMETSMLKTLAGKHRSTVTKMARKYKANIETPHGPRTCFEASVEREGRKPLVARFGGIPLQRQKNAVLTDRLPVPAIYPPQGADHPAPDGQVRVLRAARTTCKCTTSASSPTSTEPGQPQPAWAQLMAKTARKTLVVCRPATTPSTPAATASLTE